MSDYHIYWKQWPSQDFILPHFDFKSHLIEMVSNQEALYEDEIPF